MLKTAYSFSYTHLSGRTSITSLVIFHDSFSHEVPVKILIHIFWILRLLYKINRQPIHHVIKLYLCCIAMTITLIYELQWTNEHLYKNMYLSHFILERVDASVVWERWVETGTDCYIDPTSSLDHRALCCIQEPT